MSDVIETHEFKSLGLAIFRLFSAVADLSPSTASITSPLRLITAEGERFKLWSANLGLLIPGHGSLAYRLRDAGGLESLINRFLLDLRDTLREGIMQAASIIKELS
jgi:hypothetical protein